MVPHPSIHTNPRGSPSAGKYISEWICALSDLARPAGMHHADMQISRALQRKTVPCPGCAARIPQRRKSSSRRPPHCRTGVHAVNFFRERTQAGLDSSLSTARQTVIQRFVLGLASFTAAAVLWPGLAVADPSMPTTEARFLRLLSRQQEGRHLGE